MNAFHLHVQLGCVAQGLLQHLALNHMAEVWRLFRSWLRTMNPALPPSELVVACALRATLPEFSRLRCSAQTENYSPPLQGANNASQSNNCGAEIAA